MRRKRMKDKDLKVTIKRDAPVDLYPFTDYFKGFDKVDAVRSIFGRDTGKVLRDLRVEFFSAKFGYMSVSDVDGHLLISSHHLANSETRVLYLDVIHELFHVKQFMEGKKLFLNEFEYVDSPIEIPAYRVAVDEAKRLGMKKQEILDYLKVEWVDEEQHKRLAKAVGL